MLKKSNGKVIGTDAGEAPAAKHILYRFSKYSPFDAASKSRVAPRSKQIGESPWHNLAQGVLEKQHSAGPEHDNGEENYHSGLPPCKYRKSSRQDLNSSPNATREELVILSKLIESIFWQNLQRPGLERFELSQAQNGWLLRGTILTDSETGPAESAYQIACDSNWRTQQADISLRDASGDRRVQISTQNGRWYENGKENQAVTEAIDIDLGWTPSTNTLPIRRLNLAIGESSGLVTAAWIRFPDLRLQPLSQEYKRLAKDRYLYSSGEGAFKAEIVVNDRGVVLEYENFWRRV